MTAWAELVGASVRVGGRTVLSEASLVLQPGEIVGVVGPNGAGKTTLLRALLGLVALDHGDARLGGRPVGRLSNAERATLAAYLPQERRVAWSLPAWRVAALGAIDRPAGLAKAAAFDGLARVGLAELVERGVLDMSGGERARVLLARLLVTRAPLLVVDEPTAGLDPDAQFLAMEQLRREARDGRSVLVTLHDLTLAARACDRLVVIGERRILADAAPADALTPEILARAFQLEGTLIETEAGLTLAARRLHPAS